MMLAVAWEVPGAVWRRGSERTASKEMAFGKLNVPCCGTSTVASMSMGADRLCAPGLDPREREFNGDGGYVN
jgi:hypothetical protein